MTRIYRLIVAAFAYGLISIAWGSGLSPTITELWTNVDPRRDPLEIEVIKAWDEDGIAFEQLYFTGETWEGEKTRIYALRGASTEGKNPSPGMLHLHGAGQTASLEWVRTWAQRGYVCVSFDYCGDYPELKREHYTKWGKVQGDMMKLKGRHILEPTARHDPWFHWCLAARRALTLLEQDARVDPARLGVFGISNGGMLAWLIAGTDKRVRAVAPIYGCGWITYPSGKGGEEPPVDETTREWRKLYEGQEYAAGIECPVFFMSGTNDGAASMDRAYDTLARVNLKEKHQLFAAKISHHLKPPEARNLELWMNGQLKGEGGPWPATAGIELKDEATPRLEVKPHAPEEVERVEIYYALNNPCPHNRFWRTVRDVRRDGNAWVGDAPFMEAGDTIYAYATVAMKSGVMASSELLVIDTSELKNARPSLKHENTIDVMDDAEDWFFEGAGVDPLPGQKEQFVAWEKDGERGFTLDASIFGDPMVYTIGTHKIGDPQWRGEGEATLLLDCLAEAAPNELTVSAIEHYYDTGMRVFTMTSKIEKTDINQKWMTLTLNRAEFKDGQGKPLESWAEVDCLLLHGKNAKDRPPVFKRLRWD